MFHPRFAVVFPAFVLVVNFVMCVTLPGPCAVVVCVASVLCCSAVFNVVLYCIERCSRFKLHWWLWGCESVFAALVA